MGRFGALWNPRPQRCPRDPASPGPSSPPRAVAGLAVQSSSGSGLRPRPAPASPGPSPGGSVPLLHPPPARAHGTSLALSRRLHLGFSVASGYAFFPGRSPKPSSSSQRARLPFSQNLLPESESRR